MGHEGSVLSDLIGFAMILVGGYYFIAAFVTATKIDLDNVELFTMQDKVMPAATVKATVKTKAKAEPEHNQFQQDCMDALNALGIKSKKERQYMYNTTMNKYSPETIQDFLHHALKG